MKVKSVLLRSFLAITFLLLTSVNTFQDTEVFEGTYDGKNEEGYNFIGIDDEDEEEYTMTFQAIETSVLKSFNLDSKDFIGTGFIVTYSTKLKTVTDEDGSEDYIEINTITALKKL